MSEKIIGGIKSLAQFMEDGSFLMPEVPAVYRAIQALQVPDYMDYDYLLSVSGMAVRLAWKPGWNAHEGLPNQAIFYNEDDKSIIEIALDRIGVEYTHIKNTDANTALRDIRQSIDKGIPVIMETTLCVCATILGYRNNDLYGVSVFADQKEAQEPYGYNCFPNWQKEMESYYIIHQFTPKPMDCTSLKEVLQTAVYLARTTAKKQCGNAALGISSFDAVAEMMVWDESFEPLEPGKTYDGELSFPYEREEGYYCTDGARTLEQRFWDGYCDFLCMLNGYENFSRFLQKYAHMVPAWQEPLTRAAAYYQHAATYSGALWEYVTPDSAGVAKFKNKDVRYAFAAHMLRAKIYTVKAIEIIEDLLTKDCKQ